LDDVRAIYEDREKYQFLDVREPWEWNLGRIEEAVLVPLNSVMAGAESDVLTKDKPVVVVCKTGNRSEVATLMLRARGYEAENMEGGMEAWAAAGLPFSSPEGEPGRVG
jgi:rhodanese-related sulfurtransferase